MMTTLATKARSLSLSTPLSILAGSLFVALASQVEIMLPFSPVPLCLAPFAVLLTGVFLGARKGACAILAYLLEGVMGLPVFSGGAAGIGWLLGPTGGYLVGYVAAAFAAGFFVEKGLCTSFVKSFFWMIVASASLFVFGLLQLSFFVGTDLVYAMGLLPFIPGDLVKCAAVATILAARRK
jgi:biotin transport system substrate-specific component